MITKHPQNNEEYKMHNGIQMYKNVFMYLFFELIINTPTIYL